MPHLLPSLGCVFGFPSKIETRVTALGALKIARRRLRPDLRSKLLGITSTRTDASFLPEVWRLVFLDHATTGRCRIVRVATDNSSEASDQRLAPALKLVVVDSWDAIPQDKLLFDSNQALEKVREISKLKGVVSAQYHLLQSTASELPVWQLSFYSDAEVLIASFQVDSTTGKVTSQKNRDHAQPLDLSFQTGPSVHVKIE